MKKISLYILIFACFAQGAMGQDIEAIIKADPLKVTGGLSTTTTFYHAEGTIPSSRPPFYSVFNANLNLNFFGLVSAPFQFTYSPQQNDFSYPFQNLQPFNQMGISPKYKGYTAHIGYRSMHLSKYSFSGNRFMGGGFEVANKGSKWIYGGFYGRLA